MSVSKEELIKMGFCAMNTLDGETFYGCELTGRVEDYAKSATELLEEIGNCQQYKKGPRTINVSMAVTKQAFPGGPTINLGLPGTVRLEKGCAHKCKRFREVGQHLKAKAIKSGKVSCNNREELLELLAK